MKNLLPRLNPQTYVYASIKNDSYHSLQPLFIFHEEEGTTIILEEQKAIASKISFDLKWRWISLNLNTNLTEVGITAKFSKVLSEGHIPCNVVAGFYHDHIFVPEGEGKRALNLLSSITI